MMEITAKRSVVIELTEEEATALRRFIDGYGGYITGRNKEILEDIEEGILRELK